MNARSSDIKQRNSRISSRKMIAEISLPTAKIEVAEAAEAADEAVDEVLQDRTIVAVLLRSRILLNLATNVVAVQVKDMETAKSWILA